MATPQSLEYRTIVASVLGKIKQSRPCAAVLAWHAKASGRTTPMLLCTLISELMSKSGQALSKYDPAEPL